MLLLLFLFFRTTFDLCSMTCYVTYIHFVAQTFLNGSCVRNRSYLFTSSFFWLFCSSHLPTLCVSDFCFSEADFFLSSHIYDAELRSFSSLVHLPTSAWLNHILWFKSNIVTPHFQIHFLNLFFMCTIKSLHSKTSFIILSFSLKPCDESNLV